MRPSRRRLLKLAALAPVGCDRPPAARPPAPAGEPTQPWSPSGAVDLEVFSCGVQTGDPLPDRVLVSVRQFVEPELGLRVARWSGRWEEHPALGPLSADDGVVQVELTDLPPDTEHALVATTSDGRRSEVGRFRTAPTEDRTVRFAASSCFGMSGAPFPAASRAAALALDFALLLGDTVYVPNPGGWESHWTKSLAVDGLRELLLCTSVVATWDDHEVLNDWVWDQHADDALLALDSFRRALPQRIGPSGSGIWRRLSFGPRLEVFVLDTRGERLDDELLSTEQLDWLIDGVSTSPARWKVVATSVTLTDLTRLTPTADRAGWLGYPAQRERVLEAFRGRGDVIWVAGDIHLGVFGTVGAPGEPGDDQVEVICGPAGSNLASIAETAVADDQHDLIVPVRNVAVFEVGLDEVRVDYLGDDGLYATRWITARAGATGARRARRTRPGTPGGP